MVEVQVGDDDAVQPAEVGMLAQLEQRVGPEIEHEVGRVGLDQVARASLAGADAGRAAAENRESRHL